MFFTSSKPAILSILIALSLSLFACTEDTTEDNNNKEESPNHENEGLHQVKFSNLSFTDDQIPAADLADGWSIAIDNYTIILSDINLSEISTPSDAGFGTNAYAIDLVGNNQDEATTSIASTMLPDGTYQYLHFKIAPTDLTTKNINADEAILAKMLEDSASIYVAGVATNGEKSKSFAWHIQVNQDAMSCVDVVIAENSTESIVSLTPEVIFYSDYASTTPTLAFDHLAAADSDDNGEISQQELQLASAASSTGEANLLDYLNAAAAQIAKAGEVCQ